MKNIQVLERAFALLEAVAASKGDMPMLNELAGSSGLKGPTASRILCTLSSLGYLEQPVAKKGYKLGRRLLDLAREPLCPPELLAAADKLLGEYTEELGEYSCLSVLKSSTRVILLRRESTHLVKAWFDAARVEENPYSSASGRLLLSFLPSGRLEYCLRQLGAPGGLWPELDSMENLREALAKLRKDALAFFQNEEIVSLAVPLEYGAETFAIGSYIPRYRFKGDLKRLAKGRLLDMPARILESVNSPSGITLKKSSGKGS